MVHFFKAVVKTVFFCQNEWKTGCWHQSLANSAGFRRGVLVSAGRFRIYALKIDASDVTPLNHPDRSHCWSVWSTLLRSCVTVTHPYALHHRYVFVLIRLERDAAGTVVRSHRQSCPPPICMWNETAVECVFATKKKKVHSRPRLK